MNRRIAIIVLGWFLAAAFGMAPSDALAQLNEPTRELFEEMLPQLDSELQTKFKQAMQDGRSWIEFTPEQFIRFRDNPANPFDGLNSLDTKKKAENIRLEFKIPSPRDRIAIARERQHRSTLQHFDSASAPIGGSIVQVIADGNWVALGTVVTANGLIVTKASEIEKKSNVVCRTMINGESVDFPAQLLRSDRRNDIALLKIECKELVPIEFSQQPLRRGQFVSTPDHTGTPLVMGVVSTESRCLITVNQAYLGVKPVDDPRGVRLTEITDGGSAQFAGLKVGDVISELDQKEIRSVPDLVNAIRLRQPGDKVTIRYFRGDQANEVVASLNGRNLKGQVNDSKSIIDAGAVISARHSDFPLVFQHDSPIMPEHCGGPLVDLDGNVIGINIAREGRVSSLAIEGKQVQLVIDQLLRENIASRE